MRSTDQQIDSAHATIWRDIHARLEAEDAKRMKWLDVEIHRQRPSHRKMMINKQCICTVCGVDFLSRYRDAKFCEVCSAQRARERKRSWNYRRPKKCHRKRRGCR